MYYNTSYVVMHVSITDFDRQNVVLMLTCRHRALVVLFTQCAQLSFEF